MGEPVAAVMLLAALAGCAGPEGPCLVFVGDVVLARGVAAELATRPGSPWAAFPTGDAWIGNLEGTLAQGPCLKAPELCLGFPDLDLLVGGPFAALSQANNHPLDHGPAAAAATADALDRMGIAALTESGAPQMRTIAGLELAFVPVNLAGVDPGPPLERARLAIGLAAAKTPWVVVLPHWGIEGVAGLGPGQEAVARRFVAWGARLVVGSGAHVPQESACDGASATWYGLGNHLFDQRPVATHEGALVRCCPRDGGLVCTETRTRRTEASVLPVPGPGDVARCALNAPPPVDLAWQAHPWRDHFRFVQPFPSAGQGVFFALHEAYSDIDDQVGLRPYVFHVEGGRRTHLWRGSSLSRPLVAARLFDWGGEELLCALHRGDTFLKPDPSTTERLSRVYRWSGFGFREVDDAGALAVCEGL